MRRCLLIALICLAPIVSAQSLLSAYRTPNPPVVDGELSDACWQAALVSSHFLLAQQAGLPKEQTRVRVCWDDAALYIGIEAFEGLLEPRLNMMHRVPAEKSGPDANVFSDDCVEVFLQPPGGPYYHFAANSGDGTYDGIGSSDEWDCDWHCVARRGAKSYMVEMAIPLAALSAGGRGIWAANFTRHRPQAKEYSTWCGLQGAFHQPEAFGKLQLLSGGPSLGAVFLERADGGYLLRGTVGNTAGEETVFGARLTSGDESSVASSKGPGSKALRVKLGPERVTGGAVTVEYSLVDGGQTLLRSAPVSQRVAAGIAWLSMHTQDASARAHLNGEPVELAGERTRLTLEGGLNILAIEATANGDSPRVTPSVWASGRRLSPRWLATGDAPPDGWRTEWLSGEWPGAQGTAAGLWCAQPTSKAHFAIGLYVSEGGPQLFPNMDTFYVPRGSKQFMRYYLHLAPDVPSEDYRMVVELSGGLKCHVAEAIGGGMPPQVSAGAVFDHEGASLAGHVARWDVLPAQGMQVSLRWGDSGGNLMSYQPSIASGGTHGWRRLSMVVRAPKGAGNVHPLIIKWQNRGITGSFWVDNMVLREEQSDENLLKMGTFDEPEWGSHHHLVAEGVDGTKCCKIVSTAEGADGQQALWVDQEDVVPVTEGASYVVECDVRCEKLGAPHGKALSGLLFEAPQDMPEGDTPIFTYFEALNGAIIELPHTSTLTVLPPLKNARPKRARIAPCYYGSKFHDPQVAQAYADNCWASGMTWTYGRIGNDVASRLLDRGHQVFLSIGWEPWSTPAKTRDLLLAHPEWQALDFKGRRSTHQFCPTWMLAEGRVVLEALQEWLLETVNAEPYRGANWDLEQPVIDPPTFCVCSRCLEAFRTFAKLPADAKLDADVILKQYPKQWTDFRCAQNAEMAGHLKEILRKADRPVEFSLYSGYQSTRTKEHYGVDWELMAPHLDFAIAGYNGTRKAVRDTVRALGDVPFMGGEMWYLSDTSDARPTPRMETWRNRILRQYIDSGCRGCLIWWLPPMDGGAFYATSEATQIIATYEDFFRESQRCDEKVAVDGIEAHNWAAFEMNGRTLVLLMNFGDEGVAGRVAIGQIVEPFEIEPYGVSVRIVRHAQAKE